MQCNMGTLDRGIRAGLGVGIGAAGFVTESWWGLVGIVPLATALIGWCPAYLPFKIRTNGKAS